MSNKFKICTVLAENNFSSTVKVLKKVEGESDLLELRADFLSNLDKKLIFLLKKQINLPVIFTLRTREFGGKSKLNEASRKKLFQAAIDAEFDYLDLEVGSKLATQLDRKNTKLIISYHNFQSTPGDKYLEKVIAKAKKNNPDIIKIATLVKSKKDLWTLAKILLFNRLNRSKQRLIVVGMGEKGKISRIIFPYLGSFLTYVVSNNKIAAGQFTLKEMQKYVF